MSTTAEWVLKSNKVNDEEAASVFQELTDAGETSFSAEPALFTCSISEPEYNEMTNYMIVMPVYPFIFLANFLDTDLGTSRDMILFLQFIFQSVELALIPCHKHKVVFFLRQHRTKAIYFTTAKIQKVFGLYRISMILSMKSKGRSFTEPPFLCLILKAQSVKPVTDSLLLLCHIAAFIIIRRIRCYRFDMKAARSRLKSA